MIIALTGRAFSGKDTVGAYLSRAHNFAQFAFADPIREGLKSMMYLDDSHFKPENKEVVVPWIGQSPRQLMQTIGTEWGRNLVASDIWVRIMAQRLYHAMRASDDVVITDLRFFTEVEMVKQMSGQIWQINRPDADTTEHSQHQSETEASQIVPDRVITNDGTLEQLYEKIDFALGYLYETV